MRKDSKEQVIAILREQEEGMAGDRRSMSAAWDIICDPLRPEVEVRR